MYVLTQANHVKTLGPQKDGRIYKKPSPQEEMAKPSPSGPYVDVDSIC